MRKIILASLFLTAFCVMGCSTPNTTTAISTSNKQESAEDKDQVRTAQKNVADILKECKQSYDKIDDSRCFFSLLPDLVPTQDGQINCCITWVATTDGEKCNLDLYIREESTRWIFWDEFTFYSDIGRYKYKMNEKHDARFDGKIEKVFNMYVSEGYVHSFKDFKDQIKILTDGQAPVIRLSGVKGIHDHYLSTEEIESLKTGLILYNELEKCNFIINQDDLK